MRSLLVTGSSGLIGSEIVTYFGDNGCAVHGVDKNMRADFFGPKGDTRWNQRRLEASDRNFHHHELDNRDRTGCPGTREGNQARRSGACGGAA